MAIIRLTVEVPADAPERQLGDVNEFCRVASSIARGFGHEVFVAQAGTAVNLDEDLVIAVPIGYSSVIENDLAAARDSDIPVFVLLPDHLSIPPAIRENPLVVDVKRWRWLGTALEELRGFFRQYKGKRTVRTVH